MLHVVHVISSLFLRVRFLFVDSSEEVSSDDSTAFSSWEQQASLFTTIEWEHSEFEEQHASESSEESIEVWGESGSTGGSGKQIAVGGYPVCAFDGALEDEEEGTGDFFLAEVASGDSDITGRLAGRFA